MLKYGWGQGKVWGPKRIQDNDGVTQAFTLVLPSLPTVTPASPPIAGSALGSVLPFLLTLGALAGYSKPARGNASPSNHIHPPAKRFYTNSVAIKMYSMTLLILSSGHLTSFLGLEKKKHYYVTVKRELGCTLSILDSRPCPATNYCARSGSDFVFQGFV